MEDGRRGFLAAFSKSSKVIAPYVHTFNAVECNSTIATSLGPWFLDKYIYSGPATISPIRITNESQQEKDG